VQLLQYLRRGDGLPCGDAGYVLIEAYPTCERLRELVKANSLTATSNSVITLAEKCAQQALVSHLNCDDSCANINTLAPAAQGTCYTSSGYCGLGGYDAARILAMLGPPDTLGTWRGDCLDQRLP
jgi:hypothetical protein